MTAKRPSTLEVATRALAVRDFSAQALREKLVLSGVEPSEADGAVADLERAGLVSDERFARNRARSLAERGKGDSAIRFDLDRQGVSAAHVEIAIAELEPEGVRAERIVARRGPGARTARLLAGRGFSPEHVELAAEGFVAKDGWAALG